jgi:hypothetical protein
MFILTLVLAILLCFLIMEPIPNWRFLKKLIFFFFLIVVFLFKNIHITTSDESTSNIITGGLYCYVMGTLFAEGDYLDINNITIKNTQVLGKIFSEVGGIFGRISQSVIKNCHQIGFSNDLTIPIVQGCFVGGLGASLKK